MTRTVAFATVLVSSFWPKKMCRGSFAQAWNRFGIAIFARPVFRDGEREEVESFLRKAFVKTVTDELFCWSTGSSAVVDKLRTKMYTEPIGETRHSR